MLQKSSIDKTLMVFFLHPTKEHYLAEISRKIGIAHTSVKKNLEKLVKLGLIVESVDKKGKRKFPLYKSNLDNKDFRIQKISFNIALIFESKLVEFIGRSHFWIHPNIPSFRFAKLFTIGFSK